jgi:hypothetical protein
MPPATVTIDTTLVQNSEPSRAVIGDGVAMLSVRAGSFFHLNRTGGEIWSMFAERRQVREVCEALSRSYVLDTETARREVIGFVQSLVEHRLLQVVEREPSR